MPQVTIKIEIQMLGLMSLSTIFEGTSKIAYGKKKLEIIVVRASSGRGIRHVDTYTVKAMLYCCPVNSNSWFIPATRALAMLLLSRKANRYRTARTGISLKSTLRRMRLVSFGSKTGSCCVSVVRVHSIIRFGKACGAQLTFPPTLSRCSFWYSTSSTWSAELSSFTSSGYLVAILTTP